MIKSFRSAASGNARFASSAGIARCRTNIFSAKKSHRLAASQHRLDKKKEKGIKMEINKRKISKHNMFHLTKNDWYLNCQKRLDSKLPFTSNKKSCPFSKKMTSIYSIKSGFIFILLHLEISSLKFQSNTSILACEKTKLYLILFQMGTLSAGFLITSVFLYIFHSHEETVFSDNGSSFM